MYKIKYRGNTTDTEFPIDKMAPKGYNKRSILQRNKNAFDDEVTANSALDYLYADNNRSKTQGFLKNNGFPTVGDRQFNQEFYGVEEERKHMRDLLKSKTNSILHPQLPNENDRAFLHGLMGDKEGEQNYQKQISDANRALQDLYRAFRGTEFEPGLNPT